MVCEHLQELEQAMTAAGHAITFRGHAWSLNCREWVYFDCVLDADAVERQFRFPACVTRHSNDDIKSGREIGFCCDACHDGVMGLQPQDGGGKAWFPAPVE